MASPPIDALLLINVNIPPTPISHERGRGTPAIWYRKLECTIYRKQDILLKENCPTSTCSMIVQEKNISVFQEVHLATRFKQQSTPLPTTNKQTDTQTNYCNPRCACAPRVNYSQTWQFPESTLRYYEHKQRWHLSYLRTRNYQISHCRHWR